MVTPRFLWLSIQRASGSDGGDRSAINDILAARDGRRTVGRQESDEFGDFVGARGPAQRNSAERVHQSRSRSRRICPRLVGQTLNECDGGFRLGVTGGNGIHADASRTHLLGKALAVIAQRGLGSSVCERGLEERKRPLDRRDVNDDTGTLPEHGRQETAIQSDGGKEIQIQSLLPMAVGQGKSTATGCSGATYRVNQNVNATKSIQRLLDDVIAAFRAANVSLNELGGG